MAQVDPFMAASACWQATRRGAVRDRSAPIVPSRRVVGLLPDPRQSPSVRRRPVAFATVVRIAVVIDFRPPCAVARQEVFAEPHVDGGVHGPDPLRVVKAICRSLGMSPGGLSAEPDGDARGRRDEAAACYVLDGLDRRIAHVRGLSFAWINVAASALANAGWTPGLNREAATPAAAP